MFLPDLTLGQQLMYKRPPQVKACVLGLEISANDFRTKIATVKIISPLYLFLTGAPNYVYIDHKR